MYESFFGLKDKPFNMTPDPRYLYLSESHEEALAALLYGIRERKGLITLTGSVGVGKTLILYSFFEQMRDRIEMAFFPGGFSAGRVEFLRELCRLFSLGTDYTSQFEFTREIERFLSGRARAGKNIVLLVDEAQDLSLEDLNHFRFLNNLETPDVKFLQIILCGTEELDAALRDPKVLSLRQRVAIRTVIDPLDARSSVEYIHHRVAVAGGAAEDLFTVGALWRILNYAKGIPRKINVMCDNALVIAFALRKLAVEEAFVVEALESLEGKGGGKEGPDFATREIVEALCTDIQRRKRKGEEETVRARQGTRAAGEPGQAAQGAPASGAGRLESWKATARRTSPGPDEQSGDQLPVRGQEGAFEARGSLSSRLPSSQPVPGTEGGAGTGAVRGWAGYRDTGAGSASRQGLRPLAIAALVLAGLVVGVLATFLLSNPRGTGEIVAQAPQLGESLKPGEPNGEGARLAPDQPSIPIESMSRVGPDSSAAGPDDSVSPEASITERVATGGPTGSLSSTSSAEPRGEETREPQQQPEADKPGKVSPQNLQGQGPKPGGVSARNSQGQGRKPGEAGAESSQEQEPGLSMGSLRPGEEAVHVPLGKGIASLLIEHYGGLDTGAYSALRAHNPEVEDLNQLEPSSRIVLPTVPAAVQEVSEFYTVQAVTFMSMEVARQTAEAFCSKGVQNVFLASGRAQVDPGKEWFCCYIGLFGSAEEALVWRERVRQWGFPDAYVNRLGANRFETTLYPCPAAQ